MDDNYDDDDDDDDDAIQADESYTLTGMFPLGLRMNFVFLLNIVAVELLTWMRRAEMDVQSMDVLAKTRFNLYPVINYTHHLPHYRNNKPGSVHPEL